MSNDKNNSIFEGFVCESSESNDDGSTLHKLKGKFRTNYHIKQLNSFSQKSESEDDAGNFYMIEGIASSTSVDHYGTEMSVGALNKMSQQMRDGIPILPRHNSFANGGVAEWDEVIGRTVDAEIRSETVKKAKSNDNFVLIVRSKLYSDDKRSKELIKRLERGEPIGQSIGGWFEDMAVIESEEGEIERIIIQDVTLDHVAITRAPANPDSNGLANMSIRSIIDQALKANRGEANLMSENTTVVDDAEAVEVDDVAEVINDSSDEERSLDDSASEQQSIKEEYDKLKEEYDLLKQEYDSLKESQVENPIDDPDERTVTSFKDLPLAAEDVPWGWDTTTQDEVLGKGLDNWDRYKVAHIYLDPEKPSDTKAAYKLPIARMINNELMVVWRGVAAAMAALNGARGGVDMPDDEKPKAYSHLVKYYEKFDKEPPELKSISDEENSQINKSSAENENVDSRTRHGDSDMTENEMKAIAEIVTRSVLEALPKAPASTEPTAEQEKAEIKEPEDVISLRDRLERAEGMITTLMSEPVRTGIHTRHIVPGPLAKHEFSRTIEACRSEGYTALPSVIESNIDKLVGERTASHTELVDLLSAGLRSAEMEGLISINKDQNWS